MSRPAAHGTMSVGKAVHEDLRLRIGGMSCSFCVATIERALGRVPGVAEIHVNLAHEEALVRYDPARVSVPRVQGILRDLGYTVRDPEKLRSFEEDDRALREGRLTLAIASGFTLLGLYMMALVWAGGSPERDPVPLLILALANSLGPGYDILRMAWGSVRRGILNQHVLLETAALGGLVGGILGFFDPSVPAMDFLAVTVFVTTYHILSGYVSLVVRTKTSQAVRRLMALQPDVATVVRDGREIEIPTSDVRVGDHVRVRPGERVPVDGTVVFGRSAIDQSLVTGEPIPVDRGEGDPVFGGSVNVNGSLLVRATHVGPDSFLATVIRYVNEARALKPGILALVDRVLAVFVPMVLAVALATFVAWLLRGFVVDGHAEIARAVYPSLAVLVMGYPCALGMATPLAMIRGGSLAAERGVLMRSAEAFQMMHELRYAVFDKTGTLTLGAPEVTDVFAVDGDTRDVIRLAAAVEAWSEHPLGRALVRHAIDLGLDLPAVHDFESLTGVGVRGEALGKRLSIVRPDVMSGLGNDDVMRLASRIRGLEQGGHTVVVLLSDGEPRGLIAFADTVRLDARETVSRLKALHMEPVLVTGDNEVTARAVATQVGIERVSAGVLPHQKAEQVRLLQVGGARVMMVGDGINDAPALSQADVGVALGTGTDIAIEAADIIVLAGRLSAVVDAISIGRDSFRKTKQNIALAFGFNGVGIPLAAIGVLSPVWAMVAMLLSVTTVLASSFSTRLVP